MNFGEAVTEFYARGFAHLSESTDGETRAKRYVMQGYWEVMQDLIEVGVAPYMERTATGTAPLAISSASAVMSVYDNTNDNILQWVDRRELVERYGDLTITGTPEFWYTEGTGVSSTSDSTYELELRVYPANTSASLEVRYVKGVYYAPAGAGDTTTASTFGNSDQFEGVPTVFQYMIIDRAVIHAYWDNDEADVADRLEKRYQEVSLQRAARSGAIQHLDNTAQILAPQQDY